jgi:putative ABC transport system permease protein
MTWSRWTFGALAALFAAAMFVVTTRADGDSVFTGATLTALALMTAVALCGPAVMPPLVRLVCWPLSRGRGALPMLLRENTSAAARRVASTVAPVLLTVGFTVLILGSLGSVVDAAGTEETGNARVGVAVSALDGAPGLSAGAVEAIPGRAASGLSTDVYASDGRLRALGVSPQVLAGYGDGLTVKAGDLRKLTGSTVAVSVEKAADHHWRIGDAVPFTLPDGRTLPLTVVALVPPGAIPEPVLLPPDLVRAHDPNALTAVAFTDGPVAAADRAVHSLGGRAQTVRDWAASGNGEIALLRIFMLLLIVISAGYSAVAVGNTLLMAIRDRVPEFAALRLAGATPSQVLRLVASEALLLVATGTVLGAGIAGVALLSIRSGLEDQVGSAVALSVPWGATAAVAGGCLVLALAASLGPAALSLRRHPAVTDW